MKFNIAYKALIIFLIGLMSLSLSIASEPDSKWTFTADLMNPHEEDWEFSDLEYFSDGELKYAFCHSKDIAEIYLSSSVEVTGRCVKNMQKAQRVLKKRGVTIEEKNCISEKN